MSCLGDENNGDDNDDDDGCYVSDYDDNDDYMFENDDDDDDNDDDYLNMQAQFDNVDLPPGVEASVSWIKDSTSSINVSKDSMVPPSGSGSGGKSSLALLSDMPNFIHKNVGSSSSTLHVGSSSDLKKEGVKEHEDAMKDEGVREHEDAMEDEAEKEDDVIKNYECFKRFDTVNDFVDHHYSNCGFGGQQVHL